MANLGARNCWLLTGGTGLVGRFLLANLLRRGESVAALVRKNNLSNLAQRVDEALSHFELECLLPRPKIIAYDLAQPGLRISEPDRQWLAQRHLHVIHSAASIRFEAESDSGEPYLSNVQGTYHLLDVLRSLTVSAFHYVSTAYVSSCLATGVDGKIAPGTDLRESPVPSQFLGRNDYETSKIRAESMILHCDWIGRRTIYRPSIIVGDSQSGYTSTFHGFYAPLKVCHQFAKSFGIRPDAGQWLIEQLGLAAHDTKNFVPVDWVAAAIDHIARQPELHNAIYHLTNPQPIACVDIKQAIQQALEKVAATQSDMNSNEATATLPAAPQQFREQLQAYESYFDNDPTFDSRHTQTVLPHLPCPTVDLNLLARLADFAIGANFGWPRISIPVPAFAPLISKLESLPARNNALPNSLLRLMLLGPGACPAVTLAEFEGGWYRMDDTLNVNPRDCVGVVLAASDLAALTAGRVTSQELIRSGRLVFSGERSSHQAKSWDSLIKHLAKCL